MSLITVEDKLIVERAIKNNQSRIAAEAIVILIENTPYLQEAWDLFESDKRRALKDQFGRLVKDIYEG